MEDVGLKVFLDYKLYYANLGFSMCPDIHTRNTSDNVTKFWRMFVLCMNNNRNSSVNQSFFSVNAVARNLTSLSDYLISIRSLS